MTEHDKDVRLNEEEEYLQTTVTLTMEDDTTLECGVLTIFEANERDYIALLPLNEEGDSDSGEVYLYRYYEDENGEPELENITDDDEYEIAADAFDELLDAQELDDLIDDSQA